MRSRCGKLRTTRSALPCVLCQPFLARSVLILLACIALASTSSAQEPGDDDIISDFGCERVAVKGATGPMAFVNGIYERLPDKTNSRSAYRSVYLVPEYYAEASVRQREIYLFWFDSGIEQDWSIGPYLGSDSDVFAFNAQDVPIPELTRLDWYLWKPPTADNLRGRYVQDTSITVVCQPEAQSVPPVVELDLKQGPVLGEIEAVHGTTLRFQCSGIRNDSSAPYTILSVSYRGFVDCDASQPGRAFGTVGTCDGNTPHIDLPLADGISSATGRHTFDTGAHYFIAQPASLDIDDGLCKELFMRARVVVNPDPVKPFIRNCPQDIVVSTDEGLDAATVTWPALNVTDNLDAPEAIVVEQTLGSPSGSRFSVGVTQVAFRATDSSSNVALCSFTVSVIDNEPPVFFNCPAAPVQIFEVDGQPRAAVFWNEPSVDDNVAVAHVGKTAEPGDLFPLGTTVVTYTATDSAGNAAAPCNVQVTVQARPFVAPLSPTTQTVATGSDVLLRAKVTGPYPLTIEWRRNGSPLGGQSRPFLLLQNVDASASADYTVRVTSRTGTVTSKPFKLTVAAPQRGDPPPADSDFVHMLVELTGANLQEQLLTSGTSGQNLFCATVASLVGSGVTRSDCSFLDINDVPLSSTNFKRFDIDLRIVTAAGRGSTVRDTLLQAIESGRFLSLLELHALPVYEGVVVNADPSEAVVSIFTDPCQGVVCTDTQCMVGETCLAGHCVGNLIADQAACVVSGDPGNPAFCFGGECVFKAAPVACGLSDWSSWSIDAGANRPTITRSRTVIAPARNGGACPALQESLSCLNDDVPAGQAEQQCSLAVAMYTTINPATTKPSGSSDDGDVFTSLYFIAGVAAGGGVLVLSVVIVAVACCIKRRRRRKANAATGYAFTNQLALTDLSADEMGEDGDARGNVSLQSTSGKNDRARAWLEQSQGQESTTGSTQQLVGALSTSGQQTRRKLGRKKKQDLQFGVHFDFAKDAQRPPSSHDTNSDDTSEVDSEVDRNVVVATVAFDDASMDSFENIARKADASLVRSASGYLYEDGAEANRDLFNPYDHFEANSGNVARSDVLSLRSEEGNAARLKLFEQDLNGESEDWKPVNVGNEMTRF